MNHLTPASREQARLSREATSQANKLKKYPSMRQAVNMNCKECIYDPEAEGTWRMQVQQCTVSSCPLYEWRPFSAKVIGDSEEKPNE